MSRPLEELPPRATAGGYVYVIQFSNGVVKPGRTVDPRARFSSHRSDAAAEGATIEDWWISARHADFQRTERRMIAIADSMATTRSRREYFTGVSFDALVSKATRISSSVEGGRENQVTSFLRPATAGAEERIYSLSQAAALADLPIEFVATGCDDGDIDHTVVHGSPGLTSPQVGALISFFDPHFPRKARAVWA